MTRDASPVFLFLHSIGLSHHSWIGAGSIVARYHPVLALTLPGHGESDLAPDGDYSLRAHAARVIAATRAMGAERWVLVGNSLGGAVALAAAAAEPTRTAGLVLVNAAAYPEGLPWLGRLACLPGAHRLLNAFPGWMLRAGMEVGSGTLGWRGTHLWVREHAARCRRTFAQPERSRAFALSLRALYGPELRKLAPRYREIGSPALVLRGERDPLIPRRVAERLTRELPAAAPVSLPGMGHFPQEENPEAVARICLAAGSEG